MTAIPSLGFALKKPSAKPTNYIAAFYSGVTKLCEYWGFNFKYRTSHWVNVLSFDTFTVKLAGAFCVVCW